MRSRGSRAGRRAAATALAVLALASVGSAPARADGDPASDVLLAQNVFFPYQPKVSPGLEAALEAAIGSAGRATGVHFKVAIVLTAPELGLEPQYFGRPQAYARFLDREISFNQPQPLITVMPDGYGVVPSRLRGAIAHLPVRNGEASDGLTRSAIDVVLALSRHLGHPIPAPSVRAAGSSGSGTSGLVFAVPVAVLTLGGLAFAAWRRRGERARRD